MSEPFETIDIIRRQHVGLRPEDMVEPPVRNVEAEVDELRARIEALETDLAEREAQRPLRQAAP